MTFLRISPEYVPPALPSPEPLKYLLMPSNYGTGTKKPFSGLGDLFGDDLKDVKMLPGAATDYLLAKAGLQSEYAEKMSEYEQALSVAGPKNYGAVKKITQDLIPWYRQWMAKSALVEAEKAKQERNFTNWSEISKLEPDLIMADSYGGLQMNSDGTPVTVRQYLHSTAYQGIGSLAETPFDDNIPVYQQPDGEYLFNQWDKTFKAAARNKESFTTTGFAGSEVVNIGGEDYHLIYTDENTTGRQGVVNVNGKNQTVEIAQNADQLDAAWNIFQMQMAGDPKLAKAYNYMRNLYGYGMVQQDVAEGTPGMSQEDYAADFTTKFMENSITMNEIFDRAYKRDVQAVKSSSSSSDTDKWNMGFMLASTDRRLPWHNDVMGLGGMTTVTSNAPGSGTTPEATEEELKEYQGFLNKVGDPNNNPIKAITDGVNAGSATWETDDAMKATVLGFYGFKPDEISKFTALYPKPEDREKAVRDALYDHYFKNAFGTDEKNLTSAQKTNRGYFEDYLKYYYDKELFTTAYVTEKDIREKKDILQTMQETGMTVWKTLTAQNWTSDKTPEVDKELSGDQLRNEYDRLVKEGKTNLTYDQWRERTPEKFLDFNNPFAYVDYIKYADYMYTVPEVYPIQWTQIPSDVRGGELKEKMTFQQVQGSAYLVGGKVISGIPMIYHNPNMVVANFPDINPDGSINPQKSENKVLGTVMLTRKGWEQFLKTNGDTITIGSQVFNLNKRKHREILGIYKETIPADGKLVGGQDVLYNIKRNLGVKDSGDLDIVVVPVVTGGSQLLTSGYSFGTENSVPEAMSAARKAKEAEITRYQQFLTTQ